MIERLKNFLGFGYYSSDIDQFLAQIHNEYPKLSPSQKQEQVKFAKIFELRDNPRSHHHSFLEVNANDSSDK